MHGVATQEKSFLFEAILIKLLISICCPAPEVCLFSSDISHLVSGRPPLEEVLAARKKVV